jgi:hypothetical protein
MAPRLYIIMRKDIQDMNPGKSAAQAAHAQADFGAWMHMIKQQPDQYGELLAEFDLWQEDRSFGVTLVLHETLESIKDIIARTTFSGMTTDPTYPWRNYYGDVFTSKEVTCAWVFLCNQSFSGEEELMKQYKLHQ